MPLSAQRYKPARRVPEHSDAIAPGATGSRDCYAPLRELRPIGGTDIRHLMLIRLPSIVNRENAVLMLCPAASA